MRVLSKSTVFNGVVCGILEFDAVAVFIKVTGDDGVVGACCCGRA